MANQRVNFSGSSSSDSHSQSYRISTTSSEARSVDTIDLCSETNFDSKASCSEVCRQNFPVARATKRSRDRLDPTVGQSGIQETVEWPAMSGRGGRGEWRRFTPRYFD